MKILVPHLASVLTFHGLLSPVRGMLSLLAASLERKKHTKECVVALTELNCWEKAVVSAIIPFICFLGGILVLFSGYFVIIIIFFLLLKTHKPQGGAGGVWDLLCFNNIRCLMLYFFSQRNMKNSQATGSHKSPMVAQVELVTYTQPFPSFDNINEVRRSLSSYLSGIIWTLKKLHGFM